MMENLFQQQYMEDFAKFNFALVKGRGNFKCLAYSKYEMIDYTAKMNELFGCDILEFNDVINCSLNYLFINWRYVD